MSIGNKLYTYRVLLDSPTEQSHRYKSYTRKECRFLILALILFYLFMDFCIKISE